MSIIETFDISSEAIISPDEVVQPIENFPENVVVTFQEKTFKLMLKMDGVEHIGNMYAGRTIPIYKTSYRGKKIAFYHSLLGGSASGALLEEIIVKGGKNILFFGFIREMIYEKV